MKWKDKIWYEVRDGDDKVLATYETRSQAINAHTARYQPLGIYECRLTLMNTMIPKEEVDDEEASNS